MESRENMEEGRESKGNDRDGYQLPDPQDFSDRVGEALDKVAGDLSSEILSEVRRANKEESSWEKAEESAFPLSREKVSCLASEFGGRSVDVQDFRINPNADTPCPSDIQAKGRRLASKIDKIIKAKSSPARRDCRTGLVDSTNLGKFVSGQTDFYRQDAVNKPVDIACMVLKDDSGSMCGSNEAAAIETLAEIEECFKKLDKNVKLRMQAFSTYSGETMKVIKDFSDTNKSKSYTYSFHRQSSPNGGNNDAYSIALATDILAARKEKSKLLIIVSDGAPCCDSRLVKKAVNRARSMGIFVISILIGRERDIQSNWKLFQSMYEKNLLAGSLDNMGDQLFRFIKKFVASL
jgi:nitric oxide reductase activation protein